MVISISPYSKCFFFSHSEPEFSTSVALTYTTLSSFIPWHILKVHPEGFVHVSFIVWIIEHFIHEKNKAKIVFLWHFLIYGVIEVISHERFEPGFIKSMQISYIRYVCSCACKINSWSSAPTEAPLSHRKHCSSNASRVVPPLSQWLCDITLRHIVTHLHNLC